LVTFVDRARDQFQRNAHLMHQAQAIRGGFGVYYFRVHDNLGPLLS
jgi:hypothetical protein